MVKYLAIFSMAALFAACGDKAKNSKDGSVAEVDSSANQPLYPYPEYIKSQIAYVDSTPLGILKLLYENGKLVDSGYIDRNQFHLLAKEFSEPDLNNKQYRPHYTEKSFQDLTINTITFSITAKDAAYPIKQADVLLDPNSQRVKNVIIKKHTTGSDSSEIKNLLWVNNMNFQINSSVTKKDGSTTERTLKIIWDKPMKEY